MPSSTNLLFTAERNQMPHTHTLLPLDSFVCRSLDCTKSTEYWIRLHHCFTLLLESDHRLRILYTLHTHIVFIRKKFDTYIWQWTYAELENTRTNEFKAKCAGLDGTHLSLLSLPLCCAAIRSYIYDFEYVGRVQCIQYTYIEIVEWRV